MLFRSFAHRVAVVFPFEKEQVISANVEVFNKMEVGVMLYDPMNRNLSILQWPKKNKPESTIHYLHAILQISHKKENSDRVDSDITQFVKSQFVK